MNREKEREGERLTIYHDPLSKILRYQPPTEISSGNGAPTFRTTGLDHCIMNRYRAFVSLRLSSSAYAKILCGRRPAVFSGLDQTAATFPSISS